MEHVAATLRGQGGEETERLRQEHHRLQIMQVNLHHDVLPRQGMGYERLYSPRQRMIRINKRLSSTNQLIPFLNSFSISDELIVLCWRQSSLESERQALQVRSADDASVVRQKTRDLEAEGRRLQEERRSHPIPLSALIAILPCYLN